MTAAEAHLERNLIGEHKVMNTLEKLLKDFGEKSRDEIIEKFKEQRLIGNIKSKEDFFQYWASHIGPTYYSNSILSISRQMEILDRLMELMPEYIKKKLTLLEKLGRERGGPPAKPAWSSLNYSDSQKGVRLQFGFCNRGCQYWKDSKNRIGCYNCGYFAGTKREYYLNLPEEEYHQNLVKQLEWIEKEYQRFNNFDGINIVGDGSFLNFWEIPKETQIECFKHFARWENVTQVLIESRPEYINGNWLEELIGLLRSDQMLEIAVGVESTDNFIRNHCINKGFDEISDESKKYSVKTLLKSINKFNGKVKIQAYLLVKPAFLTEHEALTDSLKSAHVLYQWAKEVNAANPNQILSIKYEPIVVCRGSLLEVLNQKFENSSRLYIPPNYWTVAELLAQLLEEDIYRTIRFGAREDMDDYIALPVIPDNFDSISPIDSLVYNAVQKFNAKKNIIEYLSEVGLFISDKSFGEWKRMIGLESTSIEFLIKSYQKDIDTYRNNHNNSLLSRYDFLQKFSHYLQHDPRSIEYHKKLIFKSENNIEQNRLKAEKYIEKIAKKNGATNWEIKMKEMRPVLDSPFKNVIYKFYVRDTINNKFHLWLSVPTKMSNKNSELKEGG